ncbi:MULTISPECIES: nuclear transport factor 2 family protein [unclassified Microbulbifer]|uniref:nuclear transport factor 2 family protein n=1 Tax=unclassified Microbulbifer TaxID=2619833 RepID=UPI0024AE13BB|nr:nuclear transport factor 2 family protein [Microbulbifer sp. VAAF005]WHI46741.1 nuclear transport factor 2 family protein [Microbulbifer sp. VAAF005]
MIRSFFAILLTLIAINAQAVEKPEGFKTIDGLFAALSNLDHQAMRDGVSDDFILLEHGEVWDIEDLIAVMKPKPSKLERINYFSIINFEERENLLTINYWTKSIFKSEDGNKEAVWLESAIVKKIDGKWLVAQLHSTRLPAEKFPKDVQFEQQVL